MNFIRNEISSIHPSSNNSLNSGGSQYKILSFTGNEGDPKNHNLSPKNIPVNRRVNKLVSRERFELMSSYQIRESLNKTLNYPVAFPKISTNVVDENLKEVWLQRETPLSSVNMNGGISERKSSGIFPFKSEYFSHKISKISLLGLVRRFVQNLKANAGLAEPSLSPKQIFLIGDLSTTKRDDLESVDSITVFIFGLVSFLFWIFFLVTTPLVHKNISVIVINSIILSIGIMTHIRKNTIIGFRYMFLLIVFLINVNSSVQLKYIGLFYLLGWKYLKDPFSLNLNLNPSQRTAMQIFKYLVIVVMISHQSASFIFTVCNEEKVNYRYGDTFIWSFMILTFRSYDLKPFNDNSMFVFIALSIILYLISIYLVTWVAASISMLFFSWKEKEQNINCINDYMKKMKIPEILQKRIRHFTLTEKQNYNNSFSILSFSSSLIKKLRKEGFRKIIKNVSILTDNFNPAVLEKGIDFMEEIHKIQNDIIKQNDENFDIYYLVSGEAEVFINSSKTKLEIMTPGSYIYSKEFFTERKPCLYIKCTENCLFVRINKKKFIEKIKTIPYQYEKFCHIRDSLLYYDNAKILKVACSSCNEFTHPINNCPILKPFINKSIIINRLNYSKVQNRNIRFFRSKRGKFKTMKMKFLVRESCIGRMRSESRIEFMSEEDDSNDNFTLINNHSNIEEDSEDIDLDSMSYDENSISEEEKKEYFEESNLRARTLMPSISHNLTMRQKAETLSRLHLKEYAKKSIEEDIKEIEKTRIAAISAQENKEKIEFLFDFEKSCEFENYFVTGNVEDVIYRLMDCPQISNLIKGYLKSNSRYIK